jgi:hypothetical protein
MDWPRRLLRTRPAREPAALGDAIRPGQRHSRANTRRTCLPHHSPRPVAVGMPRRFSSAAMACNVVAPLACNSLIVGARSAARASARAVRTARAVRAASSSRSLIAIGYRQKSLNRSGTSSVYRTVC